jgi:putative tricarboxylic transport membrane protein
MAKDNRAPASAAATRSVELVVALLIVAAGVVVLIDSFRVGVGWAADGPQAGYFPNIIGWILTGVGLWIAGAALLRWTSLAGASFVSREEFGRVLAMFLPTAAYVIVLALIGIYVASFLYIATFMIWQGRYRLLPTLAVSVGVPVAMFLLFEIWFLVPLPKGPVEHLIGY